MWVTYIFHFWQILDRNGVYNDKDCDGAKFNHAVVIVGWGNLNGINFWIVRNSWGSHWGENGYFLIERGVNKCKIETYPAYVLVEWESHNAH